ncbi:Ig-like domain-containing protein, partial [Hafnia paralvei]|uniref:Ig-like domain-containing protein n=1 Tax=Hafnia paralvei TaxID=546367 RepID=UPI0027D831E1
MTVTAANAQATGTATTNAGDLAVTADNAKANGTATNAVQAKVTDATGNVVPNVAVTFSANNGAYRKSDEAVTSVVC